MTTTAWLSTVARNARKFASWVPQVNSVSAADHRAVVADFLEAHGLGWSDPDCGVNAFLEVPDGFDGGESFCRRLVEEESVVLAPGEAFGHPDHVRVGYGLPREELEEGLARLGSFLERA